MSTAAKPLQVFLDDTDDQYLLQPAFSMIFGTERALVILVNDPWQEVSRKGTDSSSSYHSHHFLIRFLGGNLTTTAHFPEIGYS